MTLYKNRNIEGIYDGPASAQSMLAASGWEPLSDAETEEYFNARQQETLDLDAQMQGSANLDPSVSPKIEPGETTDSRKEETETGE